MSVTVAPLTTTEMNAVGEELSGTASGVNNAVSRTAALLAIAVFGIVLTLTFNARLSDELASLRAPTELVSSIMAQREKLAGIVLPGGYSDAITLASRRAIDRSFVAGFRWVMLVSATLALLSAISAGIFIQGKNPARSH
jgi:preprotein translocase subunit SecG